MHKHLTWTDRLRIEKWLNAGMKPMEIADRLRVHKSTVYAELKRGRYTHLNGEDYTTEERYSPDIAEARYRANLAAKGAGLKIGSDHELARYIEAKICDEHYSPAAVVAEITLKGLEFQTSICERTIYNYIDKGVFLRLTRADLPEAGKRKQQYKRIKRKKAGRAPRGESIENRPREVDVREIAGHWEMDCVAGKARTRPALLVLSERKTRYEIIIPIKNMKTATIVEAINRLERKYGRRFSKIFKSITVDNGSEFADCAGIEGSILRPGTQRTKLYYCHPYSAYERGTNECINRMIRRFLPKGTNFAKVTAKYIRSVEAWINDYPREVLGYDTAARQFAKHLSEAAA